MLIRLAAVAVGALAGLVGSRCLDRSWAWWAGAAAEPREAAMLRRAARRRRQPRPPAGLDPTNGVHVPERA